MNKYIISHCSKKIMNISLHNKKNGSHTMYRCLQRLAISVKPNNKWGPGESEHLAQYRKEERVFIDRSMKELLYFNVFGRYSR